MKPKIYRLLELCICEGLAYGFSRAHKHSNAPDRSVIETEQYNAIMAEINEYFTFEDDHAQ